MVEYLHRKYYQPRKLQMRACHPRDLVEQVVDMCRYQNREPAITRELLDAACGSYFLEETESQGVERMKRWAVAKLSAGTGSVGVETGLLQPSSQPHARRGRPSSSGRLAARDRHRRAVHVHGRAPRRRLPADRPPHGAAAARERSARGRPDRVPPVHRRRRSQRARARPDDAVVDRSAARPAHGRRGARVRGRHRAGLGVRAARSSSAASCRSAAASA